jgi:hypothetical protein
MIISGVVILILLISSTVFIPSEIIQPSSASHQKIENERTHCPTKGKLKDTKLMHLDSETSMLDDLRLQLSRKQELNTIIGRHSNLYAKPTESDLLSQEIAQLQRRIAEMERNLPVGT